MNGYGKLIGIAVLGSALGYYLVFPFAVGLISRRLPEKGSLRSSQDTAQTVSAATMGAFHEICVSLVEQCRKGRDASAYANRRDFNLPDWLDRTFTPPPNAPQNPALQGEPLPQNQNLTLQDMGRMGTRSDRSLGRHSLAPFGDAGSDRNNDGWVNFDEL